MTSPVNAQELAQTCYQMAYFLLPQYVHGRTERVVEELSAGRLGGAFFYVLTCKMAEKEPDPDAIPAFSAHTGSLDERHDYYLIKYPSPPPVDLTEVDPERMFDEISKIVLAPYFSVMIREKSSGAVRYFILGQSPDGGTTLRGVSPGMNANLGPGCTPALDDFLNLLRAKMAAVGRSQEPAARAKTWWQFWK